MRATAAAIVVSLVASTGAGAAMTQDQTEHSLHGLLSMYAAGSVCSYEKLSFSKGDTDEMLARIKELGRLVSKTTNDAMWNEAHEIMAEGQAMANADRCAAVRQQYEAGRPYLLGLKPLEP